MGTAWGRDDGNIVGIVSMLEIVVRNKKRAIELLLLMDLTSVLIR